MFVPCSFDVMLELNLVLHLLKWNLLLKQKSGSFGGIFWFIFLLVFLKAVFHCREVLDFHTGSDIRTHSSQLSPAVGLLW